MVYSSEQPRPPSKKLSELNPKGADFNEAYRACVAVGNGRTADKGARKCRKCFQHSSGRVVGERQRRSAVSSEGLGEEGKEIG
jgi:hypothetical protein